MILTYKTSFLKCLNTMNWFVFFLSVIIAANGFGPYGALLASISTMEKRFGFNSKQSGLIMASYDIGYLAFAFPSSWLAKKISLGGSLGPAGAAIAFGAVLNFIPHFATPNAPILGAEEAEPNICSVSKEDHVFEADNQSGWLACFIIAALLTGIGNSVLWTRGKSEPSLPHLNPFFQRSNSGRGPNKRAKRRSEYYNLQRRYCWRIFAWAIQQRFLPWHLDGCFLARLR